MKNLILAVIFVAFLLAVSGCCNKPSPSFTFAFYNVENLFDTINSEGVNDEWYTPESEVPWNSERYNFKLEQIGKVLSSIDSSSFPAILGLCEVENYSVVKQLVDHQLLKGSNYNIIHKNSEDERGIDVALLYNPKIYNPLNERFIKPDLWNITDSLKEEVLTRDILYSKGLINNKDTIHVFVNHWVSRWGGQEETEPHRIKIAQTIKSITDSIMDKNPEANIIIAGDLNDNPTDTSIFFELAAKQVSDEIDERSLYNLSLTMFKNGKGTLYYRSWDMFDQIIVSSALVKGTNGLKVDSKQTIIKHDWMLYQPKKGPARPSRTSSGKNYYGGFSDHLPVAVKFSVN